MGSVISNKTIFTGYLITGKRKNNCILSYNTRPFPQTTQVRTHNVQFQKYLHLRHGGQRKFQGKELGSFRGDGGWPFFREGGGSSG